MIYKIECFRRSLKMDEKAKITTIPADSEKIREEQERWNRDNKERIENFSV